jgi:HAD superfamily hydrolase (TIGR01509 family)
MGVGLTDIVAISFDGDRTLWDFESAMRLGLQTVIEGLQLARPDSRFDRLTVDSMVQQRERVAQELGPEGASLHEIRREALARSLASAEVQDEALLDRLVVLFHQTKRENLGLFEDAMPVLEALAPQFSLGLVSNGTTYPCKIGLEGRFQFVVYSSDVGYEKPDPGIFVVASQKAGCRPDQLMHVGDSLGHDVAGAAAAGAVSVWLNRSGKENTGGIEPDYEIRSLGEVPDLLEHG